MLPSGTELIRTPHHQFARRLVFCVGRVTKGARVLCGSFFGFSHALGRWQAAGSWKGFRDSGR